MSSAAAPSVAARLARSAALVVPADVTATSTNVRRPVPSMNETSSRACSENVAYWFTDSTPSEEKLRSPAAFATDNASFERRNEPRSVCRIGAHKRSAAAGPRGASRQSLEVSPGGRWRYQEVSLAVLHFLILDVTEYRYCESRHKRNGHDDNLHSAHLDRNVWDTLI